MDESPAYPPIQGWILGRDWSTDAYLPEVLSRVVFEQLPIWSSIACPGSDRFSLVDWRRRPPGIQSPLL
ncbi:hypothetical protein PVAP13_5KG499100 [Panicum virgatum]|uniref:Uncharacterized protein n=1 Tax=Panicum virgatum TaxID=38727 RepID=A0A8T0SUV7_PANVG|nr:hypothetical protein PVAP13_5KG499100 [Panicum virgatum]